MTAPNTQPQGPDPREYLMYLRETGQRDEAALYEQYLRETGQEYTIRNVGRQQEFEQGRLGARMARLNQNDREMIAAEDTTYPQRLGGSFTSALSGIPGGEAFIAGSRSLLRGQPYDEAYADVEGAKATIPAPLRFAASLPGGIASNVLLPGGPVAQSMLQGGLLGFLDADPKKDFPARALSAGINAAVGGAGAYGADVAGTAFRAMRNPGFEALDAGLTAQRQAATAPLYAQAEREGFENMTTPLTPEMDEVLNKPTIERIVKMLRENDEFRDMPVNDPRFLSEISQTLSSAQKRALNANNPDNFADVVARNLRGTKGQFHEAVSGPGGPMPTFAGANAEYAAQSELGEALRRGADAMSLNSRSGNALSSLEALSERGPRNLLEFLKTASPEQHRLAVQGAEAAIKRPLASGGVVGMANPLRTVQRASMLDGGDLLRQMDRAGGRGPTLLDVLQRTVPVGGMQGAQAMTPDLSRR